MQIEFVKATGTFVVSDGESKRHYGNARRAAMAVVGTASGEDNDALVGRLMRLARDGGRLRMEDVENREDTSHEPPAERPAAVQPEGDDGEGSREEELEDDEEVGTD